LVALRDSSWLPIQVMRACSLDPATAATPAKAALGCGVVSVPPAWRLGTGPSSVPEKLHDSIVPCAAHRGTLGDSGPRANLRVGRLFRADFFFFAVQGGEHGVPR